MIYKGRQLIGVRLKVSERFLESSLILVSTCQHLRQKRVTVEALAALMGSRQKFLQLSRAFLEVLHGHLKSIDIGWALVHGQVPGLCRLSELGSGIDVLLHRLGQVLSRLSNLGRPQERDASRPLRHAASGLFQWICARRVTIAGSLGEAEALIPGFEEPFIRVEPLLPQPMGMLGSRLVLYLPPNGLGVLGGSGFRRSCRDYSPQHGARQPEHCCHESNH
ncbi:hypothetical protein ADL27_34000 [Streptomyces sp. NRRL F-6602]|nr:hypothetical protein ADL27_34000 [Streptomyces sp. NRRL F-6602]